MISFGTLYIACTYYTYIVMPQNDIKVLLYIKVFASGLHKYHIHMFQSFGVLPTCSQIYLNFSSNDTLQFVGPSLLWMHEIEIALEMDMPRKLSKMGKRSFCNGKGSLGITCLVQTLHTHTRTHTNGAIYIVFSSLIYHSSSMCHLTFSYLNRTDYNFEIHMWNV